MEKSAKPGNTNSITQLPIPFFGDVNNRRFMTAVMAGVLGGAGVSAAANLLRRYRDLRNSKSDETDDDTIVLTLPKAAGDGYTSMRDAKPGETKVTANCGQQFRDGGKYGGKVAPDKPGKAKEEVKKADEGGNPGPNSVGTVVANALGLTAGGLLSYEVVSRMFDALHERRLKRKLRAAQEAYVNAMSGASKRAEIVMSVLGPAERVLTKDASTKLAGWTDIFPDKVTNVVRYPTAAYLLALLAGTGATAYITKKVMDREFPEEKLKKDINRPTRIVFRTVGGTPSLVEKEEDGKEKKASAETCAAITAMLPVYMDVVEGGPNRTLSDHYVKMAASAGTDPAGLMKIAVEDMSKLYRIVLDDPKALFGILQDTSFGLNLNKRTAVDSLRKRRPATYRRVVNAAIDAHFANGPDDGFFRRTWNDISKAATKAFARMGGRDWLVDRALKTASVDDVVSLSTIRDALIGSADSSVADPSTGVDERAVLAKVRRRLRGRRKVSIEAADKGAARYIAANKDGIRKLMNRLNAQGVI